jgi:hypothetical protein
MHHYCGRFLYALQTESFSKIANNVDHIRNVKVSLSSDVTLDYLLIFKPNEVKLIPFIYLTICVIIKEFKLI